MSESIRKALEIIECLARAPEEPRLLADIAGEASIPVPTSARILAALVKQGYAEKHGKRGGYMLGPMAYALSENGPFMKHVADAASSEVRLCADAVAGHVLLAAAGRNRCHKIVEFDGSPEVKIRSSVMNGLYNSATGRLLLAYSGDDEIERHIRAYGLPGSEWPECRSKKYLRANLSKIRAEGCSSKKTDIIAAFAYPVRYGSSTLGLGSSLPVNTVKGDSMGTKLEKVRETAGTIENKLAERRKR